MYNPQQKKKAPEMAYDLESDLKDPAKLKATKERVEGEVQKLKSALRAGGDKAEFEAGQVLLQGYLAVQKVIGRIAR